MPIMPPARLDANITQLWYRTDDQMHQPIIDWLQRSGAKPHIENFCNKLLATATQEAIKKEVPKRTMHVRIAIPLRKAAVALWNNVHEQARQGVEVHHIQFAIEMLLEEAGYEVSDGQLIHEVFIPPLQVKQPQPAVRAKEHTRKKIQAQPVPEPEPEPEPELEPEPVEEEEPIDDDLEDDDDDGDIDEEVDEDLDDDEEEALEPEFEEAPISVGTTYGNGNGIYRRIDEMKDGNVAYTVVQGKGPVKEGQTGSCSYKSFVSWARETVPAPA